MSLPIALVAGGGGLYGAFVGGVLAELHALKILDFRKVAWASGASASAGNVVHAFSYPERPYFRDIWVGAVAVPRFIRGAPSESVLQRKVTLDVDELIDIFKGVKLARQDVLESLDCALYLPVYHHGLARVVRFDNQHIREFGAYEVLRAAKAVPLLFDRSVNLGGTQWSDGAVVEDCYLPDEIEKYRTLVILARPQMKWRERGQLLAAGLWAVGQSLAGWRELEAKVYWQVVEKSMKVNRWKKQIIGLEDKFRLKVVVPDEELSFDYGDLQGSLARIFDLGVGYVRKYREELEDFLG